MGNHLAQDLEYIQRFHKLTLGAGNLNRFLHVEIRHQQAKYSWMHLLVRHQATLGQLDTFLFHSNCFRRGPECTVSRSCVGLLFVFSLFEYQCQSHDYESCCSRGDGYDAGHSQNHDLQAVACVTS